MQPLTGTAPPKPTQAAGLVLAENLYSVTRRTFPRRHRLVKHEVLALLHDGARFSRQEFVIKLDGNGFGHGRIAISVPKRILKFAVDRNLVKRAIREEFRQNAVRLLPVDLLVTLRSSGTRPLGERRIHKRRQRQLRTTLVQLLSEVSRRFNVVN